MTGNESRELGVLATKVDALEKQVSDQGVMLKEVRDTITATKGGWKVLVWTGAALMALSSTLTGLLVKFWPGHS